MPPYLDTDRGRRVWRSVKSNRVSFSFGFMVTDSKERDDGVRELRAVDLYEISVTPTPANSDTRVLGWKGNGKPSVVDEEARALARTLRDLERRRREGEFDDPIGSEAARPARKSTAPIRVETFEC